MKIGFAGLGHLGKTIAQHLIAEQIELTVWNRTRAKGEGMGVPVAGSPRELMDGTEIVILNLFDSGAVREVLAGPEGLLAGNCQGKIIVDTTTNHFAEVTGFYRLAEERGCTYLECPVLGSVVPASQGALTVLVSGDQAAFGRVKPLLDKIGRVTWYLGEPGLATKMKLINNLVLGSFMATGAEAVALAEASGIGRAQAVDILLSGAGNSMILNAKKENLVRGVFPTQFSSALIYKDLHYLQDLCRTLNRPLFTGSTVKEIFALAGSRGIAQKDFSAVYEIFRNP